MTCPTMLCSQQRHGYAHYHTRTNVKQAGMNEQQYNGAGRLENIVTT